MSVRDIIVVEAGKPPYTQWVKGDYKKEIALLSKRVSDDFHVMRHFQVSRGDEYEAPFYSVQQLGSDGEWAQVEHKEAT